MPSEISITPQNRLESVLSALDAACLRAGRDPASVTLVAVSKYQPVPAMEALVQAGQRVFGENYVQDALPKMEKLQNQDLEWHFIGKLQSNKAKHAVGRFALIHTVDKIKLARTLHKEAKKNGIIQPVLIQVNIGCEPQKSGVALEELESLAREFTQLDGVDLQGLMCMPPACRDAEETRPYFRKLSELREGLRQRLGLALPHLSMGMSADYVQAIEEGASLVRVGTALFGARPCAHPAAGENVVP